jgi:hypothetical protein
MLKGICILYFLLLLYVVVSLLLCAARFLGGVRRSAFLFSMGFFLGPYVNVVVLCWPMGVICCFCVLFFPSRGPALMWRCVVCTNGCLGTVLPE